MKKLFALFLFLIPVIASAITLTWNFNDPAEEITAYCIYEIKGTNYIKIATVPGTTNVAILPTQSGFHQFTCTASNIYGESPFSNTAEYRGATQVESLKIKK